MTEAVYMDRKRVGEANHGSIHALRVAMVIHKAPESSI